jgi:hypothetical protein
VAVVAARQGEQVGHRHLAGTVRHPDLVDRLPQRPVAWLRVDALLGADPPVPVDRDNEPPGGVPVGGVDVRRFAAVPWYARRTHIAVLSRGPGLLVGMRRRFRYRLDPQGRKLAVTALARPSTTLVRDMIQVVTRFCVRPQGRRGARHHALRAATCASRPPGHAAPNGEDR